MRSIVSTSRIAVIGLGQLGSSLAACFKQNGCIELYGGSRRPETLQHAVDADIIDAGSTDPSEILPVADIVFLCMPLAPCIEFVTENLAHFRKGGIVTDVGSVKGEIVRQLRPMLMEHGSYFIGSHPMAGSEKSGIENCNPDLYKNCITFLTPTAEDDEEVIRLVREFWINVGSSPLEIDADRHDRALAASSHALHMIASAAAQSVLGGDDAEAKKTACAGGFRDVSRIAASDPAMWTAIARMNRDAVLAAIDEFSQELSQFRSLIADNNWDQLQDRLTSAKTLRDDWFDSYQADKPETETGEIDPNTPEA